MKTQQQQEQKEAIITFKDLSLDVKVMNKSLFKNEFVMQKPLLKSLNGYFGRGLNAILGSSGAGKTTFLNTIAKRIDNTETSILKGSIEINNQPYNFKKFNNFAGYIMQDDYLFPTLTVKEYLQFAADMQLKESQEVKLAKVNQLIKILQLTRCQNTLIGDQVHKGISGGERKRCSIGMELIGEPQVIVLDEPTSGLDSFTSFKLISLLKQLALENNRTIIFTIHQPSSDIWNLFDKIFLMMEGKFIYQGPGQQDILNHFKAVGFQCPTFSNPADYFMGIMSDKTEEGSQKRELLFNKYDTMIQPAIENQLNEISSTKNQNEGEYMYPQKKTTIRGLQMMVYLVKRQLRMLSRNKVLIYSRIIQVIMFGLIEGVLYWNTNRDYDSITSPQTFCKFLFITSLGMFLQSLNPQVINFSIERPIFLKEVGQNLYTIEGYLLSKLIPETITCSLFPFLVALITYWMVGLTNEASLFFFFILVHIFQSNMGNSFGMLAASLFESATIAIAFAMTFMVPQLLFGGLFKTRNDLRGWIRWMQYLTSTYYTFQAFVINEFEGSDFKFNPIDYLDLNLNKWFCIIMQAVLYVGFTTLAYLILKSKMKKLQ